MKALKICCDCGKIMDGIKYGMLSFVTVGDFVDLERCQECIELLGSEHYK